MAEHTQTAIAGVVAPAVVVDGHQFREAVGHYPTGVAIVTAAEADGSPVGVVAEAFMPVSWQPPLVAVTTELSSSAMSRLRDAGSFCVNVLSVDQEGLFRRFAEPAADWPADVAWRPAPSGAPILDGVITWLDCTLESATEAGDHCVVLGRVSGVDVVRPSLPLLSFLGGSGRFSVSSLVARADPEMLQGIRLAEFARDEIDAIADELKVECTVVAPVGEDAVFVALANRSTGPSRISLGFRVPLVPPLGAVFITSSGSVAVNQWLSRLPESDDATTQAYIAQLERVRERGYSISLRGSRTDAETFEAVRDYSSADRLPEHERRFKAIIRENASLYESDIDPDGTYDLHSIVVPVDGPMGLVQIALRIAGPPDGLSGREIERWIARLRAGARVVSERLLAQHALEQEPQG